MNRLSLDVTNALAEACGDAAGVKIDDLRKLKPKINDALEKLKASCGHEDGFFLDLPIHPVDEEERLAKELRAASANLVAIGAGGSAVGTLAIYRDSSTPN